MVEKVTGSIFTRYENLPEANRVWQFGETKHFYIIMVEVVM